MLKFEDIEVYKPYNLNLLYGHIPHDAVRPIPFSDGKMRGTVDQLMPLGIRISNTLGEIMIYVKCGAAYTGSDTYRAVNVDVLGARDFVFTYAATPANANAVVFYDFDVDTYGWAKMLVGIKATSPTLGNSVNMSLNLATTDPGLTGNGTTTAFALNPTAAMTDDNTVTVATAKFALKAVKVNTATGTPLQFTTASNGTNTAGALTRRSS